MLAHHVQRTQKYGTNLAASLPIKYYDTTLCFSTISKLHKIPCTPDKVSQLYRNSSNTESSAAKVIWRKIDMLLLFTKVFWILLNLLEVYSNLVADCTELKFLLLCLWAKLNNSTTRAAAPFYLTKRRGWRSDKNPSLLNDSILDCDFLQIPP